MPESISFEFAAMRRDDREANCAPPYTAGMVRIAAMLLLPVLVAAASSPRFAPLEEYVRMADVVVLATVKRPPKLQGDLYDVEVTQELTNRAVERANRFAHLFGAADALRYAVEKLMDHADGKTSRASAMRAGRKALALAQGAPEPENGYCVKCGESECAHKNRKPRMSRRTKAALKKAGVLA